MAKRVWVGVGNHTVVKSDTTASDDTSEEVGVEYHVDTFSIETSGALTLWREVEAGHRSELIVAYAPGAWTKCHVLGADGEVLGTLETR